MLFAEGGEVPEGWCCCIGLRGGGYRPVVVGALLVGFVGRDSGVG